MNACIETLLKRRTIYDFKPDPVPEAILEQAFEAAVHAPNHHLTEPWRFYRVGPVTHAHLADIYARLRADKRCEPGTPAWRRQHEHALERFRRIPVVVFVGQALDADPMRREEDAASVACAIQNFQLALWSEGVGCQWSTGPIIRDARTRSLLGVEETVRLLAALYVGWPACVPKSRRTHWREKTTFLE